MSAGSATLTNNGTGSVTITGNAADINATLLNNVDYLGNPNFNGTDTLTVLTTDTGGVNSDTDTVTINVGAVDDAPVNNVPGAQAATEDVTHNITGISVTDYDVGGATEVASTVLSVGSGTLTLTAAGSATLTNNGTGSVTITGNAADINATLLNNVDYLGNPNFNGTDTLTVLTTDTGGVNSDTDTVTINVGAVDDAPVNNVPGAQAATEDVTHNITGISVTDYDVGGATEVASTVLSVGSGTLTLTAAGSATLTNNGTGSVTITGNAADINATLLNNVDYLGNPNFNGTDTLTVLTTDTGGVNSDTDTVTINVGAVDDAPVNNVPGAQAATEDVTHNITGISVTDYDVGGATEVASTVLSVGSGTLTLTAAGSATLTNNGTGSVTITGNAADINATLLNNVDYLGNPNFNGTDTLTVLTTDTGGVNSDTDTVTINVGAVDDAPVNNVPGAQAATEDVTHNITGISVTDYDVGGATEVASTVLSVGSGTLTLTAAGSATLTNNGTGSVTITGNAADINATLLNNVDYLGNPNFNGTDTLTVLTTDTGGVNSDTDTVTINVGAVDDAPVNNVPGAQAATEDVTHNITGISVTDYDVGGATEVASTVLSVGSGTLTLTAAGSATLTNNGTGSVTITGNAADINATLLNNVDYLGNPNFNGTDTLTVLTTDTGGVNSDTDTVTINVGAVDDAPVNNVPGAQAATEDVTHNITGISVTDYDVGGATEVASTVLSVGSGTLTLTAAGSATLTNNGTGSVTITGNAADINATLLNNVDYLGNPNFNGTDTLTVLTTDTGGVNSDTDTVTINVGAVDDAPVNNVPGAQAATEDVTHNITGISVTDYDVGGATEVASTVLSVGSGTLTLTAAGSATLTNNGTGSVTITGNAADINATLLNNVDYLGNPNFNGTDTLTVLTTDTGGVNSDTDTVTINVGAVDDAPVNNVPGAQAATEDVTHNITGISVTDYDVGGATEVASTVLSVGSGTLTLTAAGSATLTNNGTGSVTITGNAADINATLLNNVDYLGNPNFNGTDTLTVLTTDTVVSIPIRIRSRLTLAQSMMHR